MGNTDDDSRKQSSSFFRWALRRTEILKRAAHRYGARDASDVVQSFWRRLMMMSAGARKSVRERSAWAFRVVRNAAADHSRQKVRGLSSIDDIVHPASDQPLGSADSQDDIELVHLMVSYLTGALRELAELWIIQRQFDLPSNAIAARLGITSAAVRQRLVALRRRLRTGRVLIEHAERLGWTRNTVYFRTICLRHFSSLTEKQIAAAMGCNTETVQQWLALARQQLPQEVGEFLK